MLFLFPPKFNDDFVFQDDTNVMEVEAGAVTTYLTWEAIKAAALAAGSAVAPVAIGVVGAAAIGWVVDETVGWDVIADFGQGVIDNVTGRGGSVEDIYNAETETVSITPEFVGATSQAVDSLPDSKIIDYGVWTALPDVILTAGLDGYLEYDVNITIGSNERLIIKGDYNMFGGNSEAGPIAYSRFEILEAGRRFKDFSYGNYFTTPRLVTNSGEFEFISDYISANTLIETIRLAGNVNYEKYTSIKNVRIARVVDGVIPEDVTIEDFTAIKESVPVTIEERNTYITNIIGGVDAISLDDKQAVTGVNFAELASATQPEDIDEGTANDLGILGMLATIYNYVKSLPVRIVGAFTSLFNDIINGIKAIPGAISTGVDNLVLNMIALGNTLTGTLDDFLIDVNALGNTLAGTLDDLLIDVNSLGNSLWGSLDELLIDVNALANSLASSFGGLLINLGTWFDSLLTGIGAIPGAIADSIGAIPGAISTGVDNLTDFWQGLKTWLGGRWDALLKYLDDIWSWLSGLAEWLIALIVPTSLAVLQPSITSLVSTFNDKFAFIIAPIKSFGNAYSQSKSLYDVTFRIKYRDVAEDVHVLPIAYKPAVDVFRLVANGVVVVLTYISMYNRFRKEVLTG